MRRNDEHKFILIAQINISSVAEATIVSKPH